MDNVAKATRMCPCSYCAWSYECTQYHRAFFAYLTLLRVHVQASNSKRGALIDAAAIVWVVGPDPGEERLEACDECEGERQDDTCAPGLREPSPERVIA